MKKCANCQRKFSDATVICPQCGIYLIADTTSDLESGRPVPAQNRPNPVQLKPAQSRRNPVQPKPVQNKPNFTRSEPVQQTTWGGNFQPGRIEPDPVPPNPVRRMRNYHGHMTRRLLQILRSTLRYVIPIALIGGTVYFIVLNWSTIYNVIGSCIVGGIIGGALFTLIAARGHHYSVGATVTGIVIGMVVSCILTYNLFNMNNGLTDLVAVIMDLLSGIVPMLIIIIGLLIMVRGFGGRR